MMADTNELFISKAIAIHGDRYDYSEIEYVNSRQKIKIICKIHGAFLQAPFSHLRGKNCQKCGREARSAFKRKKMAKEFEGKARAVHGDEYDYSKTLYRSVREKVTIVCKIHGEFKQNPEVHLLGHRCKRCAEAGKNKKSEEDWLQDFDLVHKGKYDYLPFPNALSKDKITIICPKHGIFRQGLQNHASGKGCSMCGFEKRNEGLRLDKSEIINRCTEIHNGIYEYPWENVEYRNAQHKMPIICKIHGEFSQSMVNHMYMNAGCPSCTKHGFQPQLPAFYYVHEYIDENKEHLFFKGGISNDWMRRLDQLEYHCPENYTIRNIEVYYSKDGQFIRELESSLLRVKTIRSPKRRFQGGSELFLVNPLDYAREQSMLEQDD